MMMMVVCVCVCVSVVRTASVYSRPVLTSMMTSYSASTRQECSTTALRDRSKTASLSVSLSVWLSVSFSLCLSSLSGISCSLRSPVNMMQFGCILHWSNDVSHIAALELHIAPPPSRFLSTTLVVQLEQSVECVSKLCVYVDAIVKKN